MTTKSTVLHGRQDPQILSPESQPSAGAFKNTVNPQQRLLMLTYAPRPERFIAGKNQINVKIVERVPYFPGKDIQLEKVEAHIYYR